MNVTRKAIVYSALWLVAVAASFAFGIQFAPSAPRAAPPAVHPGTVRIENGATLAQVNAAFGKPFGTMQLFSGIPPCVSYVQNPDPATRDPGSWMVFVCRRTRAGPPA